MDCDAPCGYITSPEYPKPLAALHDTNCRWSIHASDDQVVEIEFLDFDVNYAAEDDSGSVADPRCLQASVSLFTVAVQKVDLVRRSIGRFCNDNKPPDNAIASTSSVLEVQYSLKMTSGGNSRRGFLARYRLKGVHHFAVDAGNTTQGTVGV